MSGSPIKCSWQRLPTGKGEAWGPLMGARTEGSRGQEPLGGFEIGV